MVLGTEGLPPREAVQQMLNAAWASHAVRTMAALGLADHLSSGPRTVGELAEATGSHAPTLFRFLRTLAALGLCTTNGDGRVHLTQRGEVLRSDTLGSVRPYALAIHAPHVERAWDRLAEAVRTGKPAFPRVHGVDLWDFLAARPDEQALFDAAMTGGADVRARALLTARDLAGLGTLVDIGGGQGRLLAAALAANPGLRGVLFDRPEVLPGAEAFLAAAGVRDRCEWVGGDFFAAVPAGGDAYVLALIIHDWPDEAATAILRACHQAMAPGARLWLVEQVVQPGDAYDRAKLRDLLMLVLFGAQERTEAEYRVLLEAAGFERISVHPTDTPYSVVEAVRL
jgi:O-methyltransferase domain/IclR helix-turn-helix domain